jgi:hypothetical protein
MAKTLCDWSKGDIQKHTEKLLKLVRDPHFFCRRCARVASTPKVLCKPRKLPGTAPATGNANRPDRRFKESISESRE